MKLSSDFKKNGGKSCGSIKKTSWIWECSLWLDPSYLKLISSAKSVNKHLQNTSVNPNCYTNFALVIKINFDKWYFLNKHYYNLSAIFFPEKGSQQLTFWKTVDSCHFHVESVMVVSHYFHRCTRCDKHSLMLKHPRRSEGCRQENGNIV